MTDQVERYLTDQAVDAPEVDRWSAPDPRLDLCVVVPAFAERETLPELVAALEEATDEPASLEIIVVVNQHQGASDSRSRANREALEWLHNYSGPLALRGVDRATAGRAFPDAQAGVGEARRVGLDLAVRRLADSGAGSEGLLVCLDADAPPDAGYLDAVRRASPLEGRQTALGGLGRYRHRIPQEPAVGRAVAVYESWMRYVDTALRRAGCPYPFDAVGSALVMGVQGYCLADGMPRRRSMEDFEMVSKLVKVGGPEAVARLDSPPVRPSARASDRVPRGTGPSVRAIADPQEQADRFTRVEPPRAFEELAAWYAAWPSLYRCDDVEGPLAECPDPVAAFLSRRNVAETLRKLRDHAPDLSTFERQLHQWFDGLKAIKYVRRRRRELGGVPLAEASALYLSASMRPEGLADSALETRRQAVALLEAWRRQRDAEDRLAPTGPSPADRQEPPSS